VLYQKEEGTICLPSPKRRPETNTVQPYYQTFGRNSNKPESGSGAAKSP
jgi:hypothetical protein